MLFFKLIFSLLQPCAQGIIGFQPTATLEPTNTLVPGWSLPLPSITFSKQCKGQLDKAAVPALKRSNQQIDEVN